MDSDQPKSTPSSSYIKYIFAYFIVVGILVVAVFFMLFVVVSRDLSVSDTTVVENSDDAITDTRSPQVPQDTITQAEVTNLRVLATSIPSQVSSLQFSRSVYEEGYLEQPAYFDPETARIEQVTPVDPDLGPQYHFEFSDEYFTMQVIKGQIGKDLVSPYSIDVYYFGDYFGSDYVIDLKKNGKRIALLQRVKDYSISPDKKSLELRIMGNYGGKYVTTREIFNIDTETSVQLPVMPCTDTKYSEWINNNLITYYEVSSDGLDLFQDLPTIETEPFVESYICIWDNKGNFKAILGANLLWRAAADSYLADDIGILPNNPTKFYTVALNNRNQMCELTVVDFADTTDDQYWSLELTKPNLFSHETAIPFADCEKAFLQVDLSKFTYKDAPTGLVRYRNVTSMTSNGGYDPIWSDWNNLNLSIDD